MKKVGLRNFSVLLFTVRPPLNPEGMLIPTRCYRARLHLSPSIRFFPVSYPFTFFPSPHISPHCCVSQPKKIAGPTKGWENGAAGHPRSPDKHRRSPVGRSVPSSKTPGAVDDGRKERKSFESPPPAGVLATYSSNAPLPPHFQTPSSVVVRRPTPLVPFALQKPEIATGGNGRTMRIVGRGAGAPQQ